MSMSWDSGGGISDCRAMRQNEKYPYVASVTTCHFANDCDNFEPNANNQSHNQNDNDAAKSEDKSEEFDAINIDI